MSRWFRVYDEMLDDPKVQKLHPALFKVLINLWCVASRQEGVLPTVTDLSFMLRMSEDETLRAVTKLGSLGFIDTDPANGVQHIHGWDKRQFRSDSSAERVKAHRKRQKTAKPDRSGGSDDGSSGNRDVTLQVTAPETEADTDSETDISVAIATGTIVPHPAADFCKAVFDSGADLLIRSGMVNRDARSLVGRWRKSLGDAEILTLIRQSEIEGHSDPAAWLIAAVETRNGNRPSNRKQPTEIVNPWINAAAASEHQRYAGSS